MIEENKYVLSRYFKPRPVDHSSTLRGEGSKAGKDRRPPKLLTDAVNFLFNLLYDRAILILTISLILAIIFYVIGQVEATPLTQNFTG